MNFKAYETSSAQKRLYMIDHLLGSSVLYNEVRLWVVEGRLDPLRLRAAVEQLGRRHEALRTCFVMKEGEVLQKVYEAIEGGFNYTDNGAGTGADLGPEVEEHIDRLLTAYDLGRVPLWKIELVQLAQNRQLLWFDFHHIVADGTSMEIIIGDLISLYQGKTLPPLEVQYVDFTMWQNDLFSDGRTKEQEDYWLKLFEGEIPLLALPTDFVRSKEADIAGSQMEFVMDEPLTAGVRELASRHNTSLYVVLLAVYNVLLAKYANQQDIVVGTPIAARSLREFGHIVGMFVNTLAMRNRPVPARTFEDFLMEVSQNTFAAFENQDYQFEMLVERVVPQRQLNRNPLFDTMFALQNYPRRVEIPRQGEGHLCLSPYPYRSRAAKFDLVLQAFEADRRLIFRLEYRAALFKEESVERLTGHFLNIFREVVENGDVKLSDIRMLSAAEVEYLLYTLNGTDHDFASTPTIHGWFEERVEGSPDAIAVVGPMLAAAPEGGQCHLSYRRLNEQANRLAQLLRAEGVGPEAVVGLLLNRSLEMVAGVLGILKAGGAYLPLEADYPPGRILSILEESDAGWLLTAEEVSAPLSFTSLRCLKTGEVEPLLTPPREAIADLDSLPLPDRTLVDYRQYHRHIGIAMAQHTVSLQATRGCPFNCAYCHKIWPKKHVVRSAGNIFSEISRLHDAGVKRFVFIDDIFNLERRSASRLLETIEKRLPGIQLFFPNGLRGDILTRDFIDLLMAAGTVNIDLALESACPRIQKLMGKNLDLEKFDENVRCIIHRYPQLLLEMELMIGFPTESEDEALMTLDYLMGLEWVHFPNLNILKIYPNTEMYQLAVDNGISPQAIESSVNLAYHELPDTLPFSRGFTRMFQARFMNEYMQSRQRLLALLPYQAKILTRGELIQKYDSYFPQEIRDFPDILQLGDISPAEMSGIKLPETTGMAAPDFVDRLEPSSVSPEAGESPLRLLLLDLSQYFSTAQAGMLYDMVEEPLGLMYLLTHLHTLFKDQLQGRIAKSRIDFDSFAGLRRLIDDFKPHIIGIRTLSYYREFFHRAVALIRQWGVDVPIIAGGPYATSDFRLVLQDSGVDLVVLGEGERTLGHLVGEILKNGRRLPPEAVLRAIPGLAFIKEEDKSVLRRSRREVILLDQTAEEPGPTAANPGPVGEPHNLLYLISTSGSTGQPKGVMLEHRNLVNLLQFQFHHTDVAFDRVLQFASIGFDVSAQEIFSSLLWGGTLYLINRELRHHIEGLLAFIAANDIRVLFLPPAFLKLVFEEQVFAKKFPRCPRHIIAAGEQLLVPERFRHYLDEGGVYLHNHYGPSETHVVTTLTMAPAGGKPQRPSIGRPIANTRVLILDEHLKLKPLGVVGEVCICGANVGRGYCRQVELTASKYGENPFVGGEPMYRTGDLGRWLGSGEIEFLGRKDQQVKIRGFRIELEEIENHLLKIAVVREAVVVDCEAEGGEKYLAAFLVYDGDVEEETTELRRRLARSLPDYMIPAYFKKLEAIPLNRSGKVDRHALRRMAGGVKTTYAAPASILEEELLDTWADVLKKERGHIGVEANFFDLGGHSLNATILLARVHRQHGVLVPLVELFQRPTVRDLALYIRGAHRGIYERIAAAEEKEYYPQSAAQRRLFFLGQLQNIGTGYNMPAVFKIGRELERPRIEQALRQLVRRHESLRTSFALIANQPVQRVHRQAALEIEYYPGGGPAADTIDRFIRPFDLSAAPLFRVGFLPLDKDEALLMVDMHHIITDGTSIEISIKDFMALYDGARLPPLALQYKDFSAWQDSPGVKEAMGRQEKYWLKTFAGEIPVLALPSDRERPEIQGFRGDHIDFEFGPDIVGRLRTLARKQEATLYMLLLAAFNVLLFKLTGQQDMVVGTPIAARRHGDLEKIIGMFVNTLAMRNYPEGGRRFNGFLRDVRERSVEAFENQDFPFEELVDRLSLRRDMSRNPLFDVMFALHNQYEPRWALRGAAHFAKAEPFAFETHIANFDLELHGNEVGDRIYFVTVYSTDLFDRETVERFAAYFRRIVFSIIEDPRQQIAAIDIIAGAEKKELLERSRRASTASPGFLGRVDRARPKIPGMETEGADSAPPNQLENRLAEIWAGILNIPAGEIGVHHDFFALGGHSLKATVLIARLHQEWNVRMPVETFFKVPTIRGIAGYIEKALAEVEEEEQDRFVAIEPVEKREYYPLSSAQKRIYFLYRLDEESLAFNMPLVMPLGMEIRQDRLESTFRRLIRRHESLRTAFRLVGEQPVQQVHEAVEFAARHIDSPAQDVEEFIRHFVRPFDLGRAPLLRSGLIKLADNRHIWVVDVHHIVSDGTSQAVLADDFLRLYRGEDLPPLRLQYRDFSAWQDRLFESGRIAASLDYWLALYGGSGEIPRLNIAADYRRPQVFTFAGDHHEFVIPAQEAAGFRKLAADSGGTLYMNVLTALNVLFYRYSGQEDIIIGSGVAGRPHADLQLMVGNFINTLALRNYPAGDKTYISLLKEVIKNSLRAFENQDVPFEELVNRLDLERDTSRNPLFDVLMVVQNFLKPGNVISQGVMPVIEQDASTVRYQNPTAKFDISFFVLEMDDEIHVSIEYYTGLFKAPFIGRLAAHLRNVIRAVTRQPALRLNNIELMDEEEKHRLLSAFNDTLTTLPADRPIHCLFEDRVETSTDHLALAHRDHGLSYRELNEQAARLARYLYIKKGVRREDRVGIQLPQCPGRPIAILGVLKTGAAYVPLEPSLPMERVNYIVDDAGIAVVVSEERAGDRLGPAEPGRGAAPLEIPAHSLAYIIYTSGTTGSPKGVMVAHGSLVNLCRWHNRYYRVTAADRASLYAGFGFDAAAWEMFPYLIGGASLHLVEDSVKLDVGQLNAYYERQHITIGFLPSQFCEQFMGLDNRSLRRLLTGGDRLRTFVNRRYRLYNNYGPTESTVVTTSIPVEKQEDNIPIGKPIDNTRVYILNQESLLPQPIGAAGELCIAAVGLARGYLNSVELTAEKFIVNTPIGERRLYRSGDLARWRADGTIEFLGRIDQQVKVRGFRIEPGEIENHLLAHPGIREAVVLDREDEQDQKFLCAYIVPQPTSRTNRTSRTSRTSQTNRTSPLILREFLSLTLPDYMIPSYFVQLDHIPLTPNGKIDRKALPPPQLTLSKADDRPGSRVEAKLAEIWAEVLNIGGDQIGPNSNFFDLGGHSLKATVLVSRIHEALKVKLPLAELFKRRTIRELSGFIGELAVGGYKSIEPVEKREYYPLSSAQKRLHFIYQVDVNSTSYNIPLAIPLDTEIRRERLEATLRSLIRRHESLRTSFRLVGEQPVQVIHETVDFAVEYIDSPAQEPIRNFVRAFDLSRAPLLRSGLIRLADGRHIWVIDAHHIVADGTSHAVLTEDFVRLYRGEALAPLRLQYRDFSGWQNRLIATGEIETQVDYWTTLYGGEIPRLNLAGDYRRPEIFTFAGDQYEFELSGREAATFKKMAADLGGTLYMSVLAALNVLFYRYTGQEDIIIGSGIAGRTHVDLQQMVGMFVNTLALRSHPGGHKTYLEFFSEVKDACVEAYENQDLQFEELVDRLNLERDASRNPLFDVMSVVQNFDPPAVELHDLTFPPLKFGSKTAKFDLTLFAWDAGEKIYFELEYYTGIFGGETIERMARHFVNVVRRVTAGPGIRLGDIEILTEAEKQQLLIDFNATVNDYPKERTIRQLFEEQVDLGGDRIAVVFEDRSLTYRQLDEGANQLAAYLYTAQQIRPDVPVGILMDRGLNRIVAILGILKAGGAYVPIDPSLPEERVKYMIDDARIGVVISQARYIKTLNRLQWACDSLAAFLCMDSEDVYAEEEVEKSELMDKKLWEYVGQTATDEVTGGGWLSSYTGEPIPRIEMDEYGDNILQKLSPLLHREMRVLEIGCASGITMYRIAPRVGFYYGTDLSSVIIDRNRQRIAEEGHRHIALACLPAHRIDEIEQKDFDLVIINSVIQCFHGHNYLRRVIGKAVGLLKAQGYLFIGDIMDQALKPALAAELTAFQQANRDKGYKTRTDWSTELFVSKGFWQDLQAEINAVAGVEISPKIYTIENELTRFRYDVLLTIDKGSSHRQSIGKRKHQDDRRILESFSQVRLTPSGTSHQAAYLIYTSGTTGVPRGVIMQHRSLVNLCYWHNRTYRVSQGDRATLYAGFGFDASVWELFPYLLKGASLHVIPDAVRLDIEKLNAYYERCHITIGFLPTQFYEQFMERDNRSLRVLLTGGDRLHRFAANRYDLYNNYGPTENTVVTTACRVQAAADNLPIGKPIDNTQVLILDRDGRFLQPIGVPGELCITGEGLARGYLNNPELTAEKFINLAAKAREGTRSSKDEILTPKSQPLYRTGDLCRFLPDGNIEFLGRIDFQVKIRGCRIELAEVETHLLKHDAVKETVVIDREHEQGDRYLIAYIVAGPSAAAISDLPADLREFLAVELPGFMIPAYFVELDKIPLNPSGKVDRRALLEPESQRLAKDYVAPRTEMEGQLAAIWAEVLGREKGSISVDADFFQLGGHSLKATILLSRLHKELNIRIPLAKIFSIPTVRELAKYIRESAVDPYTSIQPVEKKEYYPLSPAQERIYVLQQVEVESTAYNSPLVMRLEAEIDGAKLEGVFRQLIRRHENFRTAFAVIAKEPVQRIAEEVDFAIHYDYDGEDMVSDIECGGDPETMIKNFVRPFDLAQAPLLRVELAKLSAKEYVMMVDIHHIITDGTSSIMLMEEFAALYEGLRLPPLRIQYKDYSVWQNRADIKEMVASQGDFWLRDLKGGLPVLNLPLDFERPQVLTFSGQRLSFEIPGCLAGGLRQMALRADASIFMVLLSVFNVFLSRICGQEEVVMGTAIAGRRHHDLQYIVGMFVNTLVLKNRCPGDKTFADFLDDARERTLAAFDNQDYQFDDLVNDLSEERRPGRNPLFDVMFVLQNIEIQPGMIPKAASSGLEVKPFDYRQVNALFDLMFMGYEEGEGLGFFVDFNTRLFRQEKIERLIEYFKEVTARVVENPEVKLKDISLSHDLSETNKRLLREDEGDFAF